MAASKTATVRHPILAIAEVVKELGRVPSGHVYAHLMGVMSLDRYDCIIAKLVELKQIKIVAHELIWIG